MEKYCSIRMRKFRNFVALIGMCLMTGFMFVSCWKNSENAETNSETASSRTPSTAGTPLVEVNPNLDFSNFEHANPMHERLPCSLCHVRTTNTTEPKLPGHLPCSGCHVEQFEDKKGAMCAICHTDAETGAMKSFPGLKSFSASFDHGQHTKQTNCATCHKPSRRGVAMSIPSRATAHSKCFECHTFDKQIGEMEIGSCETCHTAGRPPRAVTESARAFSLPFSHANHRINCTECHTVRTGSGRGNQVAALVPKMHFPPKGVQSCATCHNNKRAFGGDDFKDCKRCHKGKDFQF